MALKSLSFIHCSSNLPPGPRKLPLIGNLHQLVTSGSQPHRALADLSKQYGPLMHLQLGELSTVVVSSPDAAMEVMKNHDLTFATRPHTPVTQIMSYDGLTVTFAPYGEHWRQLRKICVMEVLTAKRVQSFRSIREEEILELLKKMVAASQRKTPPINLTEEMHTATYSITSRAAFRMKSKEQTRFIDMMREVIRMTAGFSISDVYPSIGFLQTIIGKKAKVEMLHRETDRILENIINQHKLRNGGIEGKKDDEKDLVDVLLQFQDEKAEFPLTNDMIKAVLLDIFTAGSETSATTTVWAMSELLKNPAAMRKAQQEVRNTFDGKGYVDESDFNNLRYLKSVIKEALRLHPPLPLLLPRECQEKCEILGFDIPVKTKVIVNAWAIGRDPMLWAEANRFRPERFLDGTIDYRGNNFEYIPFGAGRRICPGISFGSANIELPLAMLLYHFDWELPDGMDPLQLDMTERFGTTVERESDLYLVPVARRPLPSSKEKLRPVVI